MYRMYKNNSKWDDFHTQRHKLCAITASSQTIITTNINLFVTSLKAITTITTNETDGSGKSGKHNKYRNSWFEKKYIFNKKMWKIKQNCHDHI